MKTGKTCDKRMRIKQGDVVMAHYPVMCQPPGIKRAVVLTVRNHNVYLKFLFNSERFTIPRSHVTEVIK